MAKVISMPKLGFDMAEGTLVRWVKQEGDQIIEDDVLAEIETDKATVEVEAHSRGVLKKQLVEQGATLPVGTPIAVVGEEAEEIDLQALLATLEAPPAPAGEPALAPPIEPTKAPVPSGTEPGERPLLSEIKASPVARRLARQHNLDLTTLKGSGPGGRIVKKDVEAAFAAGPAVRPGIQVEIPITRETTREPLSKLRAAIGRRMVAAKQDLPHFYLTTEIDAEPLMSLRSQLNELLPEDDRVSVNDFIVKAAALALRQFPNLNASLDGESIVRHGEINIGVAVAVDDGLLTVVIHNADQKPLRTIASESRTVIGRAREGRVRPQDIEGSTFTVSNLGMFDIEQFLAIINPPEAAILAVGSVRKQPVVDGDAIKIGQRMKFTLSADHRVTDGAEAARWLQVFREILARPLQLIL